MSIVLVGLAFLSSVALAREYAPGPSGGGFAKNPDGTYTYWIEIQETLHRTDTWTAGDYEQMGRAFRTEELLTEGTLQGTESGIKEVVKNVKTAEIGEAEKVVENIKEADPVGETLSPYNEKPVLEVGQGIEDSAAADSILPDATTALSGIGSATFMGFLTGGGVLVTGISIGNTIDVIAGWPTVENFIEGLTGANGSLVTKEFDAWEWKSENLKVGAEVTCKSLHELSGGASIPTTGHCWPVFANRKRTYYEVVSGVKEGPKTENENGIGGWEAHSPYRGGTEPKPCEENRSECEDPRCPTNPKGEPLGIIACSEENGTTENELRPRYRLFINGNVHHPGYDSWTRTHKANACEQGGITIHPSSCEVAKRPAVKTKLEPPTPTEWNPKRATEEEQQHAHREHHEPLEEEKKVPSPIEEPEIPEVKPNELQEPYVNEVHTNGFPTVEAVELSLERSDPEKGPEAVTTVTPSPGTHTARGTHVKVEYNNKSAPEPAPEPGLGGGITAPSPPGIKLPEVSPICTSKKFPFGLPCWFIGSLEKWIHPPAEAPCLGWGEMKGIGIGSKTANIPAAHFCLAPLEPVMEYYRPAVLIFVTFGFALFFYKLAKGGSPESGSQGDTVYTETGYDEATDTATYSDRFGNEYKVSGG